MSHSKIAITGANGYIGSYLVKRLSAEGHTVFKMLRKTVVGENSIPYHLGSPLAKNALDLIDILIHCAYDFSLTHPNDIQRINVEGSLALFEEARKAGVKKIIYLSSTSAFESALSHYGKAKFSIEERARKLNVITLRPGLVFNKNVGGIIGSIGHLINKLPIIPIIGKGDQLFFPCHLDDLANLVSYLVTHPYLPETPIIAASNQALDFKAIIKTIAKIKDKTVLLIPMPYPLLFAGLKLTETLGLKLGLRSDSLKYMKHYNKNPDFSSLEITAIKFRPFTVETIKQ